MADSVYQPPDSLLNKIKDQNRNRSTFWGNRALAAVPMADASLKGGPGAAAQLSPYFFPQRKSGFSPEEAVGYKAKLLKDMSSVSDDLAKGKIGLAEALAKQDTAFKTLAELAGKAAGDAGQANATVASAFNNALAEVDKHRADAMLKQISTTVVDPRGLQEGLANIEAVLNQVGPKDPGTSAKIREELNNRIAAGDSQGAAALAAALDVIAPQYGLGGDQGGFRTMLANEGANGDQAAQQATALMNGVSDDYAAITTNALKLVQANSISTLGSMKTGAASADTAMKLLSKMMAAYHVDPADPQKTAASVEEMIKAGMPQGGTPLENYKKLLDQIDSDTVNPASTLGEARRRLFADPEFQQWKQENGFQDDSMALKELRRMLTEKVHSQRQQDRTLVAERKTQGVGPNSGPPQSAKMVSPPTQARPTPQQPGPTEPKIFKTDDNKISILGEDGKLRQPTPEDLDHVLELWREDPTGSFFRPASEYDEAVKAQTQSNQANSQKIMGAATAEAATLPSTRPTSTPSTVANEAGYLATHPGELSMRAGQMLFGKARKKKVDEAVVNQAGVIPALDEI